MRAQKSRRLQGTQDRRGRPVQHYPEDQAGEGAGAWIQPQRHGRVGIIP